MKFSLGIKKHNAGSIGIVRGHNERLHATKSQQKKEAWLDPLGYFEVVSWRSDVVKRARNLANRKDAVLAIQFSVQLGNQTDWRELPTPEYPAGEPKKPWPIDLRGLVKSVEAAYAAEFGADNIISISLHMDESSPHIHVVVAPITADGKLQAKTWLDGAKKTGALRKRIWQRVAADFPCEYTPGSDVGGEKHDASKRAGERNGPKPEPGIVEKVVGLVGKSSELERVKAENERVKAENERLRNENQTLFSRLKALLLRLTGKNKEKVDAVAEAEKKAAKEVLEARNRAKQAVDSLEKRVELLSGALARERATNDALTDELRKNQAGHRLERVK